MTKYHIGSQGEPSICRASKRPCPYGGPTGKENHYNSRADAIRSMEKVNHGTHEHTASKGKTQWSVSAKLLDGLEFDGKTQDELLSYTGGVSKTPSGIETRERKGELVDKGYVSQYAVRGKIDLNTLNENSYKDFGFKDVSEQSDRIKLERAKIVNSSLVSRGSQQEMKNMDNVDKSALAFFSSNNYGWFNGYIMNPETINTLPSGNDDDEPFIAGEAGKDIIENYAGLGADRVKHKQYDTSGAHKERITQKMVADSAQKIDTALEHSPKEQRILYRGIWNRSPLFNNYESVKDYVDENLSLGSEIQFNGYQSSSMSSSVGHMYSDRNGVEGGMVYEILTPEGVNMTSVSQHTREDEVLLPRNQRYVVVGRNTVSHVNQRKKTVDTEIVQIVAVNKEGEVLDGTNSDPIEPFSITG